MLGRPPLRDLAGRLVARVRARPDTEFQQALIRFAIGVVAYLYFSSRQLDHPEYIYSSIHFVALFFLSTATAILARTLIDPRASPSRRLFGAVVDISTSSFLLMIGGETSAPLVGIYLWVVLGNGFRYGVHYLHFSTVLAALGFGAVLAFNAFWSSHLALGIGILFTMVIVPLYASTLTRQLHAAVQRATEANQAKSLFLANMSHELRTPLNGVIGVADLMAGTKLDKEQQEFANIIRASANTLLELIDNVLDITRIEAGHVDVAPETFDPRRLAETVVAMMAPQAVGKNLLLVAHVAPQTPAQSYGDARHLRQILINLIGNAIKFTEQGRVDVYVRPSGKDLHRLHFEIVDTGIGISEAMQARIFERFTQADASITRRFGGSGLGTTIAKQLVEALGGEIGVKSRLDEGTTFWFELPFAQPADMAEQTASTVKPLRVALLAGDELSARIQQALSGWGTESVVVDSTTALAAELSAGLSCGQPLHAAAVARTKLATDPTSFLKLLRDDPRLADLPVILIESDENASQVGDHQLLREGYAAVLRTPVNTTLLFDAIYSSVRETMPPNVVSLADHLAVPAQGQHLRVLVAEDNPVNQRVIRGFLEQAGHEPVIAQDGEEALTMLESDESGYQLAIIDMHMPTLSGPELVQRWRFMERDRLPIIMLTADARPEARAACEAAGADAFLTKPLNRRELMDAIARATKLGAPDVLPSRPAPAGSVIDEAALDDLAGVGGPRFVQDLIASFTDESDRLVKDIERALAIQDYGEWHERLHMLKGGASDIGATALAARCAEAERVKPFEFGGPLARERLDRVMRALADARTELAAYEASRLRAERL